MENNEDTPAWHFERNGVFTVKSAYKLAFDIKRNARLKDGGSINRDDTRKLWDLIWKSKVPNKVRIFAWRCAVDNLATKKNKWRRTLEVDSTCSICGANEESNFHATVACTKAKDLRFKMREVWNLPTEDHFRHTCPDWLLLLLANSSTESIPLILLLLWRAWHLRNNIFHEDGKCLIEASSVFLHNYVDTLNCSGSVPCSKGKFQKATGEGTNQEPKTT